MTEKEHDYTRWFIIYLITVTIVLFLFLGIFLWYTLSGSEWNRGYIAARNNPENVGKLEIAGVGDNTIQKGRGK